MEPTSFFLVLVAGIFLISAWEWLSLLAGWKLTQLQESAPTWLPEHIVAQAHPGQALSLLALLMALARHLSGQEEVDRAQRLARDCACCDVEGIKLFAEATSRAPAPSAGHVYVEVSERRFNGVQRCC